MDDTANSNQNTPQTPDPVLPVEPIVSPPEAVTAPPPPSSSFVTPPISDANMPSDASHGPKSHKKLYAGLIVLLLMIALPVALFLSQQSQDIRQRASTYSDSTTSCGGDGQDACVEIGAPGAGSAMTCDNGLVEQGGKCVLATNSQNTSCSGAGQPPCTTSTGQQSCDSGLVLSGSTCVTATSSDLDFACGGDSQDFCVSPGIGGVQTTCDTGHIVQDGKCVAEGCGGIGGLDPCRVSSNGVSYPYCDSGYVLNSYGECQVPTSCGGDQQDSCTWGGVDICATGYVPVNGTCVLSAYYSEHNIFGTEADSIITITNIDPTQVVCSADTTCTAPIGGCIAVHSCDGLDSNGHCTVSSPDVRTSSVNAQSEANSSCKCVQVDVLDGNSGSCENGHINGDYSTLDGFATVCPDSSANCSSVASPGPSGVTPPPPPGSNPPPPPPGSPVAQCVNVKVYKVNGDITSATNWTRLTSQEMSALAPSDIIYVTTQGTSSNGATVTRARIRVNSNTWTLQNETINKKPKASSTEADEYYVIYTIPAGMTTFTIGSEVYSQQFDTNTNPSDGNAGWR